MTSPPADRLLDDGERIELAGFVFLVGQITGHSPGSVVYIGDDLDPPFAFVGDVLFAGSVGRTDFPGGSAACAFRRHPGQVVRPPRRDVDPPWPCPANDRWPGEADQPLRLGEHAG